MDAENPLNESHFPFTCHLSYVCSLSIIRSLLKIGQKVSFSFRLIPKMMQSKIDESYDIIVKFYCAIHLLLPILILSGK